MRGESNTRPEHLSIQLQTCLWVGPLRWTSPRDDWRCGAALFILHHPVFTPLGCVWFPDFCSEASGGPISVSWQVPSERRKERCYRCRLVCLTGFLEGEPVSLRMLLNGPMSRRNRNAPIEKISRDDPDKDELSRAFACEARDAPASHLRAI